MHPTNKMQTLFRMIASHPKEKTLVFCQFVEEMNYIQRQLEDREYPVYRIDGSVDQQTRILMISEFKKASTNAVFVIQVKSGGQGLNLQEATRVYITAPSWNPATELQAIGRSHRTGQTQKVTVRKLVYTGYKDLPSIEGACVKLTSFVRKLRACFYFTESIIQLQNHKAIMSARVLNDPNLATQIPSGSNSISARDLKRIFEIESAPVVQREEPAPPTRKVAVKRKIEAVDAHEL